MIKNKEETMKKSVWGLAFLLMFFPVSLFSGIKGPDRYGYLATDNKTTDPKPDFNWVDARAGTCYAINDDSYININLPFGFNFYGVGSSWLYISDNGFIIFGSGSRNVSPTNGNFEDGRLPNTWVIAPFWDDLLPKETSRICYIDQDVNSDGQVDRVYEWYDFAHQGDPDASFTFEVIFFRGTSQIAFQYLSMKNGNGAFGDGSSATIGIRDYPTNYRYLLYSYNTQGAVRDGLAIVFDIDSDGDYITNTLESKYGTNWANSDSDAGGVKDGGEVFAGKDPLNNTDDPLTDTDGDSIPDAEESVMNLKPNSKDSDSDGVDDDKEISAGWNPLNPDTDKDGLKDGEEDKDNDGIVDANETDPNNPDTDGDFVYDGVEVKAQKNPLDASSSIMIPEKSNVNPNYNGCELAQVAVDSNGNANVLCDNSDAGHPVNKGLTYLFFDKDGNILINETFISMSGGRSEGRTHRPRLAVLKDNTVVIMAYLNDNDKREVPFFIRLNPYLDDRDGSSANPAVITLVNKELPLDTLRHIDLDVDSEDNIHAVGEWHTWGEYGYEHEIRYLKLNKNGEIINGPLTIVHYGRVHHKKNHPKIAVDSKDNIHIIWRDTDGWGANHGGRTDITYTKLDKNGNVLIPERKLGFPNRLCQADISAFYERIYVAFGGHSYFERPEDYGGNKGLSLYLGIFETGGNSLEPVLNFKEVIRSEGHIVWQHQTLNHDKRGNLHMILSGYDNASILSNGYYYASFDYNGNLNIGPVLVSTSNYREQPGQDVYSGTNTIVHMAYQGATGDLNYRTIDVSSFMKTAPSPSTPPVTPVYSNPVIKSVSPDTIEVRVPTEIRIIGEDFMEGATVTVGPSTVTQPVIVNSSLILASVSIDQPGTYDLLLQNPDGITAVLSGAVTVVETITPGPRGEQGCVCSENSGSLKGSFLGFLPMLLAFLGLIIIKRRSYMKNFLILLLILVPFLSFAKVNWPDNFGYIYTDSNEPKPLVDFNWIDATSGNEYRVYDDQYVSVSMGISSVIYGITSNQLYIYDNGFIAFSHNPRNPSPTNGNFEDGRLPNSVIIAPFWDDLLPKETSRIYTLSTSICGMNAFVVEWYDFAHQGDPNASFTFEVILYQNSKRVDFNYLTLKNRDGAFGDGSSATIGVRADYRNVFSYTLYSFNQPVVHSGLSIVFDLDTDKDRLSDTLETCVYNTDPTDYDTDDGKISDGGEIVAGTDPLNSDPLHDPEAEKELLVDSDGDGLYNSDEMAIGTDPNNPDTDGDGVPDGKEFSFKGVSLGTNPLKVDTDEDGLSDGYEDEDKNEIMGYPAELNPLSMDSDGDGVSDSDEIKTGTDPLNPDDNVLGLEKKDINPNTSGCELARVAADEDGNAHVVCDNQNAGDPQDNGITYLMLDKDGNILIDETWIPLKTSPSNLVETKRPRVVFCGGLLYVALFSWNSNTYSEDPFLIILDPSKDNQDGDPADPADIVVFNSMLPVGSLRHIDIDADSECNIHLVGEWHSWGDRGEDHEIKYLKISKDGEILNGPLTIVSYGRLHHKKNHPKIAVDSKDNIHIVWRDTDGWGGNRTSRFALYYTKLDNNGNILIPTTKLPFPNRFCKPDISTFRERVYVILPGHDFYESRDDYGRNTGLSLYLAIFDTSNNTLQKIKEFERVFSGRGHIVSQRTTMSIDENGNTHIFFPLRDISGIYPDGYYYISTDYNGNLNIGPILLSTDNNWEEGGIAAVNGVVHTAYQGNSSGDLNYRKINASSFIKTAPDVLGGIEPVVKFVSPSTIEADVTAVLTIKGENFLEGATVTLFNRDITSTTPITDVVFVDHETLYAEIKGGTLQVGKYDLTVVNADGYEGTLESALSVVDTIAGEGLKGPKGDACGCTSSGESAMSPILIGLFVWVLMTIKRRSAMRTLLLILIFIPSIAFSSVKGYDRYGYVALDSATPGPSVSFNWIDATAGTCDRIADDTLLNITLPFNFNFYEVSSTLVYISDNGFIALWEAPRNVSPTNGNFEDGRLPNTWVIAPFWDDLLPKETSRICYIDQDVNSDGQVDRVYEWYDFAHQGDPDASFTFEVIFFRNRRLIKFQYLTMTNGSGAFGDGSSATIGIRRNFHYGRDYVLYSFNRTSAVMNNFAIAFDYDTDHDRIPDSIEASYGTNQNLQDTDGGGVFDGAEVLAGTNPAVAGDDRTTDTDNDTILDDNETFYGLNKNSVDSDSDGIPDNVEDANGNLWVDNNETDPLDNDSDDDGLKDGEEDVNANGTREPSETDPRLFDTDGDLLGDGFETSLGKDPLDYESTIMSYEKVLNPSTNSCYLPSVATDSNGNAHIVCANNTSAGDPFDDGIIYLMLDKKGNVLIDETLILPKATFNSGNFEARRARIAVDSQNRVHIVFFAQDDDLDLERGFYILLNPYLDNRNGSPANPDDITIVNKEIPVDTLRHIDLDVDSKGNAHIVGELHTPDGYSGNHHEILYFKIGNSGEILAGPVTIVSYGRVHHKRNFPKITVDSQDNVHIVWRDTDGKNGKRTSRFGLYYTKLDNNGNTLIPTTKLPFQNRFDRADISSIGTRLYVVFGGHNFYEPRDDYGHYTGLPLYLGIFDTYGDSLTTVLSFREIVKSGGNIINKHPSIDIDSNGNTHIFFARYDYPSGSNKGYYYFSTDYNGNPNIEEPFMVSNVYYASWVCPSAAVAEVNNKTILHTVYYDGSGGDYRLDYRRIDVSSFVKEVTVQIPEPVTSPLPPPVLKSVSPSVVDANTETTLTILGENFQEGLTVQVGGLTLSDVFVDSEEMVIATFPSGVSIGTYDLTVINPDGKSATLPQAISVQNLTIGPTGPKGKGGCECSSIEKGFDGGEFLGSLIPFLLLPLLLMKRRFSP
jgi:hypothetical protein